MENEEDFCADSRLYTHSPHYPPTTAGPAGPAFYRQIDYSPAFEAYAILHLQKFPSQYYQRARAYKPGLCTNRCIAVFTIYNDGDTGSTLVSNLFIDEYMGSANDAQIKVYLYLLRMMNARRTTSISDMADQFNHTEREILRSLRYWEKQGLLILETDSTGNIVGIRMGRRSPSGRVIPMSAMQSAPAQSAPVQPAAADSDSAARPVRTAPAPGPLTRQTAGTAAQMPDLQVPAAAAAEETADPHPADERREPTSEEIRDFCADSHRSQLLFVIEQYVGKPLSAKEIRTVYYISEQLHFSDELIDYLLQYCVDRGKRDFRYIEKVAVRWAEDGVTTPRQAERVSSSLMNTQTGRRTAVRPERNKFNQFPQHEYDFDELERDLLGS